MELRDLYAEETNKEDVYTFGDVVSGVLIVILAMATEKKSEMKIYENLINLK